MPDEQTPLIHILLVEDNDTHAHLIKRYLKKTSVLEMDLDHVTNLQSAFERFHSQDIDIVLLDLSLPDSEIDDTLPRMIGKHPEVPIIVLTSLDDVDFATRAVGQGAQDFLVKAEFNGPMLIRAITYAIERKKTQERLESYAAELESSNAQLQGFAHTVAHEVKSPLTVVSACLQMLAEKYRETLADEDWELVEDTSTAIHGLTTMVADLLEFSQIGSERPSFEDVDMEAAFYHSYVCLRPAIKETHAVITHDPLPSVQGNEVQLRQLLLNLIGNAIKYCDKEHPEVHISAEEGESDWTFRIQDNGLGIQEDDKNRIFDAFVRLQSQRQIQGSGIGLAFCKRIIENHEGKLWVESEPGKGSTFYFEIPKETPDSNPE